VIRPSEHPTPDQAAPLAGDGHVAADAPIGIVAVQGDFAAHAAALARLSQPARLVRKPADLADLAGLILPGGESTTMLRFLAEDGLAEPLVELARQGLPIFGTCAGLILMARQVSNPVQDSLGLMDVVVRRNGYGRQVDSFIDTIEAPAIAAEPVEGVFIRAPTVEAVGASVEVLGTWRGEPVLIRQGLLLACTFHPELSTDLSIHRFFVDMLHVRAEAPGGSTRSDRPRPASSLTDSR
jgi:5'-phosphate synthase pdxT subunit